MIRARFALAVAATVSLSACGGGGGGGLVTAPPPPPTNASLTSLQYSQDFSGNAGVIQFSQADTDGSVSLRNGGTANTASAQVRYDAATQSYTLIGTKLPATTFAATDRSPGLSDATRTAYEKDKTDQREILALFAPGATNTKLALTYASYGTYQAAKRASPSSIDLDTAFFTYGVVTAPGDMPRTGSATYTNTIDGQFVDSGGIYTLVGASSFAADFAAATVAFSVSPVGKNNLGGADKLLPTQNVKGQITSGNQFSGTGSAGGYTTSLGGYFYGPAAAEIGGTFAINGNGGVGVGVVVGKKN